MTRLSFLIALCAPVVTAICNTLGLSIPLWARPKVDRITISMIRQAMPNIIAADIVGVQPLCAPSGLIFAMRNDNRVMILF